MSDKIRWQLAAANGVAQITALRDECDELRAEVERLREALKPFAAVAENDIGDSETDCDLFRPVTSRYAKAPLLTVGDFRQASAALKGGTAND